MATTSSLNLANYATVFNDDFTHDSSLNGNLWPIAWGNPDDFSFANGSLTLTSSAAEGWSSVGFLQADFGATSGQGYGLYSVTASLNAGEGMGVCICLWPSNNVWPGPELDMLESWDSTRQSGYATIHWAGSDGSNEYDAHSFQIDLTQKHTYSLDWEAGSLTYYIDGNKVFATTANVPTDAAHGGTNASFGAEVINAGGAATSSSVSVHLYDMSYATLKPASADASTGPTVTMNNPGNFTATITGETVLSTQYNHCFFLQAADQTLTATGGRETITASGGGATITTGAYTDIVTLSSNGNRVDAGGGTNTIVELGSGNTIVLPPAGSGTDTIWGSVFRNGDVFDLRAAMSATEWDGNMADLGDYLQVHRASGSQDVQVLLSNTAHGSGALIATLVAQGNQTLATFQQHAVFA